MPDRPHTVRAVRLQQVVDVIFPQRQHHLDIGNIEAIAKELEERAPLQAIGVGEKEFLKLVEDKDATEADDLTWIVVALLEVGKDMVEGGLRVFARRTFGQGFLQPF